MASVTNAWCCVCKAAAREELRQRLGLTGWGDKPLVGVVSRLTAQKGEPSAKSPHLIETEQTLSCHL